MVLAIRFLSGFHGFYGSHTKDPQRRIFGRSTVEKSYKEGAWRIYVFCITLLFEVGRSVSRSVGRQSVIWSVCRSVGLSVGRSVGLSVCRSVGLSVGRSVCRSVGRGI